jgi:hypothetical protein
MEHEASTLATLAHEISHKYQEIYGISWGTGLSDEYHNEVLTDITAVFLGLGKLLLNGCEHSTATQTPIFKDGNRYTQTTTHTHKCGYLTRKQLVFVYRLVCAMRGISPVTFTSNLSGEARAALSSCEREFDSYFLDSYRDADASDRETAKLQTAVRKLQRSLSEVERQRAYLTSAFRHAERSVTRRAHTHITGALSECAKVVTTQHHDPCLRYLAAMRARHVVTKAVRECDEFMREAESRRELLMGFSREVRLYKSIFPEPSSPMFAVVRCPHDGTELQVPEGSTEFIARCPKCAYEFFADTSVLVIEPFVPPQPDASSKTRDRQNSWEGVTRVSKFIKRVAERVKRAYRA